MRYRRKTRDAYLIEGNYGDGWEIVMDADNRADQRRLLLEYREKVPKYPHRAVTRRVKIEN